MQREWPDTASIEEFLSVEWPETVVEIGTGTGAFSLYLATWCAIQRARFCTVDTGRGTHPHQEPNDRCLAMIDRIGGIVKLGDAFDPETIDHVRGLFVGKTFVYCDGGDKPRELATYSPLIPVGSFIGAHDFGTEVLEQDLAIEGFAPWREDLLRHSNNRILQRVH